MGLLDSIPIIGKWFDKGLDIAAKAVTNKDELNKLISHMDEGKDLIGKELYIKALETKTIPWVDALHKMGRQILNIATIIAVTFLLLFDVEITGPAAIILGGPNTVYQFMKKVGK